MPFSRTKYKSPDLSGLGAAFIELHVGLLEGKEMEKEKETGKGGAKEDREGEHERTNDAPSGEKPSESAAGATKHPATKLKVICGGKEIDKKPITILLSTGLRRDRRRPKRL